MDQMVKATLASVRPNTIDVRDQEGNTLLILACQHACEVRLLPTASCSSLIAGAGYLFVYSSNGGVGLWTLTFLRIFHY